MSPDPRERDLVKCEDMRLQPGGPGNSLLGREAQEVADPSPGDVLPAASCLSARATSCLCHPRVPKGQSTVAVT